MSRREWEQRAVDHWQPLTDQELDDAWQWAQRYGPTNNWTGTTGTAAAMIRFLLLDRARMLAEAERNERKQRHGCYDALCAECDG